MYLVNYYSGLKSVFTIQFSLYNLGINEEHFKPKNEFSNFLTQINKFMEICQTSTLTVGYPGLHIKKGFCDKLILNTKVKVNVPGHSDSCYGKF